MENLCRNPVGWDDEQKATFQRRRLLLAMIVVAAQFACAFGFGAFFVARSSGLVATTAALVAGAAGAGVVALWRRKHPYPVQEPQLVQLKGSETEDEEDEGGWDLSGILLAAVVVPIAAVVKVVFASIFPLLVIAVFAAFTHDVSGWHAALAVGLCLLVMICVEFGITRPLAQRWGIDLDD